jgi:glycoprotein-N-acetylgalactosamine 3-beta-galactosyltransferase
MTTLTILSLGMMRLSILWSLKTVGQILLNPRITSTTYIPESGSGDSPRPQQNKTETTTTTNSPPRKRHPHKGALDEFNNWGYVHDPTVLHEKNNDKNASWPFPTLTTQESGVEREELCADVGSGPEGSGEIAIKLFSGHIQVLSHHEQQRQQQPDDEQKSTISTTTTGTTTVGQQNNNVRIMCAVYSYPRGRNQTTAILQTWGKRCDGFFISSTETRRDEMTVHIPHMGPDRGKYDGLWQRVRSMLAYMHDNFLDDYDFFLLCGDDTYVIIENLRALLTSKKFVNDAGGRAYPNPMYLGAWTHPYWKKNEYADDFYFNGGGAGYVINRRTLQLLVQEIAPVCRSKQFAAAEDLYVGECLQKHLNLTGYDSRDEEGRERFFVYDPVKRAEVKSPDEARQMGVLISKSDRQLGTFIRRQIGWLETFKGWTPKYGIDAISRSAISFHKVQPASKMRRYERLLYRKHIPQFDIEDCGGLFDNATKLQIKS